MNLKRCSGVLLPISSLPGKYGIGQIGKSAYNFIDFLKESGFSYWEILPLCPTNNTNSPFQGTSIDGKNTYLIDLETLVEEKLLNNRDFKGIDFGKNPRKIDYKKVFLNTDILLKKAFKRFDKEEPEFKRFLSKYNYREYAIYCSLKELNNYKPWYDWKLQDRYFDIEVVKDLMKEHEDIFLYHMFTQYIFLKQWNKLHDYAKSQGIEIIGQVPHFVGYDSDVVYIHPEKFLLDKLQRLTLVAGFPPDEFSKEGQKWGEPLYDWDYMKSEHYKWLINRLSNSLEFYDKLIINHFSGLYKAYGIPFRANNAKKGVYIYGPGNDINNMICNFPIIASDLGNVDFEINKYINETGFPTLVTIRSALLANKSIDEKSLPSNIKENCIAYIGNHDNEPLRSSIEKLNSEELQRLCTLIVSECNKLGLDSNFNHYSTREIYLKIIALLGNSNASYTSFLMQDILYQGEESRLNYPGKISDSENWTYRFLQSDIDKLLIERWKNLNNSFNR